MAIVPSLSLHLSPSATSTSTHATTLFLAAALSALPKGIAGAVVSLAVGPVHWAGADGVVAVGVPDGNVPHLEEVEHLAGLAAVNIAAQAEDAVGHVAHVVAADCLRRVERVTDLPRC